MLEKINSTKLLFDCFRSANKVRTYKKNEIIQTTGDNDQQFIMVESGFVKRYMITDDGTESVQSVYGDGYFFPLTPVFECLYGYKLYDGPENFFYESMCDTEVYEIDLDYLEEELEKNPLLYHDLLKVAGRRLRSNIQRLESQALSSSYMRVGSLLLYFATDFGTPKGSKVVIDIPLTHQDIANSIGLARETVTRELSKLKEDKLITTSSEDGHIVVIDKPKLFDVVYNG